MMSRQGILGAAVILLVPALTLAQSPVESGTVEISGSTGFLGSFQTLGSQDEADDINITNLASALGVFFYPSASFGVGVTGALTKFTTSAGSSDLTANSTLIGPAVKFRIGGGSAQFVLTGGAGITRTTLDITGQDFGSMEETGLTTDGFYWVAGGEVDFFLNDFVSLDVGAKYQASTVTDDADGEFDVAGLTVGVGFSLYFN